MWGLLPLYLRALRAVPALEVVAHRVLWSFGLLLVLLAARKNLAWLQLLRARPRIVWGFVASALALAVNWFVYIWAVGVDRVVDASLGYFINPLLSVVLAVVVLKERLRRLQWAAVGLAFTGVLWLATLSGQVPWVGLTIAVSWASYGLLRKTATLNTLEGLALETSLLVPLAAGYLIWLSVQGNSAWSSAGVGLRALLLAAGPLTAAPLLCFTAGARRIPLSLLGVLQYLGPTLQLALGVLVFKEPFPATKLVGFALIWFSLLLYAVEGLTFANSRMARAA